MPVKTKFTELVGVEHPVMCGGMHYVGYAELAAAVSEAGGFGVITALTQPSSEDLRKEIQKCRGLTSKPFGVNLTLLPALTPPDYDAYAKVVVEEGIKVVETAGRSPEKFIKLFKSHNIKVIHKCTSIRHALSAQRMGVDMLSMDGFECGGHPGEDDVTNWVLIPKAARVLQVPFIVSGSCADGKQLAAALALGAEGMNMGTRFMVTKECGIHQNIKKAIIEADERNTALVMRSVKNTERVFKNKVAEEVLELEAEKPGEFEHFGHLLKGLAYKKSFYETGNAQDSIWSCGQVIGLIDSEPSCKELISGIVAECESVITGRMHSAVHARL